MTRILVLFQLKSVRSAWVFLIGSIFLFFFGMYLAVQFPSFPLENSKNNFELWFFLFWFIVTGAYIAIASWALFSAKGCASLSAEDRTSSTSYRTGPWHIKFLFACYAAAFATLMFLGVLSLPFAGYAGLEIIFSAEWDLYLLITALIWSPLLYRYLK